MQVETGEIGVGLAESAELREKVFRLRYDVYVEELDIYAQDADHERRLLTDDVDEHADVLAATVDGQVVGTGRVTFGARAPIPAWMREEWQLERFAGLVPEDRMCLMTRLMVRRDFRGTAVPLEIMAAAVRRMVEMDVDVVFTDCEPHLLSLYSLLGFRPYCGTVIDENGDLNVPLICLARDRAHFVAVGSPALGWGAEELDPDGGAAAPERILERCDTRPPVAAADPALARRLLEIGGVFAGLEEDEVAGLVARSHVLDVDPGTPLLRMGQRRRNVYVVVDGSLRAEANANAIGPGEIVGEVAFLTGVARTTEVSAGADGARILTISDRTLRGLMDSHSRAAAVLILNVARTLAHRLAGSPQPG